MDSTVVLGGQMFVRSVRATVVVLAIAWAGSVMAQERIAPEFPSPDASDVIGEVIADVNGEETYVADPSESFIVEHSGQIAAAALRPAPPRADRCREYSTDENGVYGGGLACPQPDGSWRIVSGAQDVIRPRQGEERTAPFYPEYPDYTDDERDGPETVRSTRRFRLDWNAWNSARRGNSYRSYGYRND